MPRVTINEEKNLRNIRSARTGLSVVTDRRSVASDFAMEFIKRQGPLQMDDGKGSKEFFFVLSEEYLTYWSSEADCEDAEDPIDMLDTTDVTAFQEVEDGFDMKIKGSPDLKFRTGDRLNLDKWVEQWSNLVKNRIGANFKVLDRPKAQPPPPPAKKKGSFSSEEDDDDDLEGILDEEQIKAAQAAGENIEQVEEEEDESGKILMQGELAMMKGLLSKTRFFVLTEDYLTYWGSEADMEGGDKHEGLVDLSDVVEVVETKEGFQLLVTKDKNAVEFKHAEADMRANWMNELEKLLVGRLGAQFRRYKEPDPVPEPVEPVLEKAQTKDLKKERSRVKTEDEDEVEEEDEDAWRRESADEELQLLAQLEEEDPTPVVDEAAVREAERLEEEERQREAEARRKREEDEEEKQKKQKKEEEEQAAKAAEAAKAEAEAEEKKRKEKEEQEAAEAERKRQEQEAAEEEEQRRAKEKEDEEQRIAAEEAAKKKKKEEEEEEEAARREKEEAAKAEAEAAAKKKEEEEKAAVAAAAEAKRLEEEKKKKEETEAAEAAAAAAKKKKEAEEKAAAEAGAAAAAAAEEAKKKKRQEEEEAAAAAELAKKKAKEQAEAEAEAKKKQEEEEEKKKKEAEAEAEAKAQAKKKQEEEEEERKRAAEEEEEEEKETLQQHQQEQEDEAFNSDDVGLRTDAEEDTFNSDDVGLQTDADEEEPFNSDDVGLRTDADEVDEEGFNSADVGLRTDAEEEFNSDDLGIRTDADEDEGFDSAAVGLQSEPEGEESEEKQEPEPAVQAIVSKQSTRMSEKEGRDSVASQTSQGRQSIRRVSFGRQSFSPEARRSSALLEKDFQAPGKPPQRMPSIVGVSMGNVISSQKGLSKTPSEVSSSRGSIKRGEAPPMYSWTANPNPKPREASLEAPRSPGRGDASVRSASQEAKSPSATSRGIVINTNQHSRSVSTMQSSGDYLSIKITDFDHLSRPMIKGLSAKITGPRAINIPSAPGTLKWSKIGHSQWERVPGSSGNPPLIQPRFITGKNPGAGADCNVARFATSGGAHRLPGCSRNSISSNSSQQQGARKASATDPAAGIRTKPSGGASPTASPQAKVRTSVVRPGSAHVGGGLSSSDQRGGASATRSAPPQSSYLGRRNSARATSHHRQ